jgi:hypothetical protein
LFAREATNSLPPSSSSTAIHPSFPLLQTLEFLETRFTNFAPSGRGVSEA